MCDCCIMINGKVCDEGVLEKLSPEEREKMKEATEIIKGDTEEVKSA